MTFSNRHNAADAMTMIALAYFVVAVVLFVGGGFTLGMGRANRREERDRRAGVDDFLDYLLSETHR